MFLFSCCPAAQTLRNRTYKQGISAGDHPVGIIVLGHKPGVGRRILASANWPVALLTFGIAVVVNIFGKGLTKVLTIVLALVIKPGYLISIPFGLVDFSASWRPAWFGIPSFTLPKFDVRAIITNRTRGNRSVY